MKSVAVIGGGIQGCCIALALANAGFRVTILDKAPTLISRASINNEGKIHLGFVYAMDRSLLTGRNMIESALCFASGIEEFTGCRPDWTKYVSTPFIYAVHNESHLSPDEHVSYFSDLVNVYNDIVEDTGLKYLGTTPCMFWRENSSAKSIKLNNIQAQFETAELAIDTRWLAKMILKSISGQPNIKVATNCNVTMSEKKNGQWIITYTHLDETTTAVFDITVNCAWENRLQLDRNSGFTHEENEIVRIKYGFIFERVADTHPMPSLTITHGPFGDLVHYLSSNKIYLSWYPDCMTWLNTEHEIPEEISKVCSGIHPEGEIERIIQNTLNVFNNIVPNLNGLVLNEVRAGTIVGKGKTDITDSESGLHRRINTIEEPASDYYSVFTGKYTCAPLNAMNLSKRITG